ncbi:MAG TPA: hypothetical protein PKI11_00845 [Candidatus Hydrogenedentes bacterium]|nr:hypothetical protein [Candidatus Hydrogenedentota bacterium]
MGACLWLVFALSAVAVRGVRWEENYEFAQVLLGAIMYPAGHPLYLHAHNTLSLQAYLTAALLWIDPDPGFACGVRNVLYILAKTLPFYLLGAALTGRARWGHAAAVLALFAGHGFAVVYPSCAWPMFAGNGAVGTGTALLGLACLCMGRVGAAYAVASLMPAWHIGQCLPLLVVVGIHAGWAWRRGQRAELRRAGRGFLAGATITLLTLLLFWRLRVPWPDSEPYYDPVSPGAVWTAFMTHYAAHRGLSWDRQQVILAWAVLSGGLLLLGVGNGGAYARARRWLGVYLVVIPLTVWSIMIAHGLLGSNVPHFLVGWMPYRLSNHLIPLLVAFSVTVAASTGPGRWMIPIALLSTLLPHGGDRAFLVLAAAAVATVPYMTGERPRLAQAWSATAGVFWLLSIREFALEGAFFAAPFLGCVLAHQFSGRFPHTEGWRLFPARAGVKIAVGLACIAALSARLCVEWRNRDNAAERLAPTDFELRARAYLAEHAAPDAMIAAPVHQWRLQARLGYPVITDAATHSWLPYHPRLGPGLYKLYRDLYGIDLLAEGGNATPFEVWRGHWTRLSPEEWRALGEEYDFRFVFAPTTARIALPIAVEDDWFRLHYLPK